MMGAQYFRSKKKPPKGAIRFLVEKRFLVENKYYPAKGEGVFTLASGFFVWKAYFRPFLSNDYNQSFTGKKSKHQ